MLIGSKLPPQRTSRTYFNLGRAAFAYLVETVIKPVKVYLPTYVCWSLVATMVERFPDIELEFYPVDVDLYCHYPDRVGDREMLVYINYFGAQNFSPLPLCDGFIVEDTSHSFASTFAASGDFVFGSLRKFLRVGDGGYIEGFFNPVYEPTKGLDTWLRYEATGWEDMREAENMIDRGWQLADISGQSLAVLLASDLEFIRARRIENELFLFDNLVGYGEVLQIFQEGECPLLHNRLFPSWSERDSLCAFLASRNIFVSIHWPVHSLVQKAPYVAEGAMFLADHVISFPVSQYYNLNDMEYIVRCVKEWNR